MIAAVCRIREVVADAALLCYTVVSIVALENSRAAEFAVCGGDEPVCAHGGFFVFLTALDNHSVSLVLYLQTKKYNAMRLTFSEAPEGVRRAARLARSVIVTIGVIRFVV